MYGKHNLVIFVVESVKEAIWGNAWLWNVAEMWRIQVHGSVAAALTLILVTGYYSGYAQIKPSL